MMAVTTAQDKEQKEGTRAGMLDCQKALMENSGNIDKSIVWLREKGLSKAAKKSGRTTAEGLVVTKIGPDQKTAVILEFNSETDFVGKNSEFVALGNEMAEIVLNAKCKNLDELLSQKTKAGKSVKDTIADLVAKVGENMQARRFETLSVSNGVICGYSHMGGKIGSLVALEGATGPDATQLCQDIAMHVAACSPRYLTSEDVDPSELEQEKSIIRKKILSEGKPENIVDKIVTGNISKFYKEVCLVEQEFVKDPSMSVKKLVETKGKAAKIANFVRFGLGEGIEKKTSDFAAEVAALT